MAVLTHWGSDPASPHHRWGILLEDSPLRALAHLLGKECWLSFIRLYLASGSVVGFGNAAVTRKTASLCPPPPGAEDTGVPPGIRNPG